MIPQSLPELAQALRSGRLDLLEYVEAICDQVETRDVEIQALVPEPDLRGRLRAQAFALQERFPAPEERPPLYGVLLGVKDIFHADGFPTRAGSLLPPEVLAGPEAGVVAQLRAMGALVLGKTVTTEFANFAPGPTRNPHNLEHTPGGSSSGSAAAVAAGFCPIALGTQTIGSVIRPAAFCGIVGFKPSYGRLDRAGLLLCTDSVDHVGLFTRDMIGMEYLFQLLTTGEYLPSQPGSLPVLGVPDGPYLLQTTLEGLEAFEAQLRRLKAAGYTIRRVPVMNDIAAINNRHKRLVAAEMAGFHSEWFAGYTALYRERTAAVLREGQGVGAAELAEAQAGRAALRTTLEQQMAHAGIDLWVCPPALGAAPKGIEATGDPVMNLPWTHAGMPAISVPAGTTPAGLPLGLQLVAGFGEDEQLLQWAKAIEEKVV